jgi:3-oxoacyl-[acyl-carrier-protein] synthase II
MGCILGVGFGGLTTLEQYHTAYLEGGPRKFSPFLIPMLISNLGPGHVAIRYGLKGINYVTTSACASSTHAIGESFRLVADGLQDVMVTGGAESTVTPVAIGGFAAMRAISTRNEEPERASRPFDRDRDGFVVSEGAAILILEELEAARRRNAPILAEVVGYGFSCDAFHMTAPDTEGSGAVRCMQTALARSDLRPEEIDYVNAHGTSTTVGDVSETLALKELFGDHARNGLLVSSTKSVTGHLLGAAGGLEAAFSVLAIRDGVVPPTANLDTPDEQCDLDYVPHTARAAKIRTAMSNSFGFGGTNATVIVRAV